MEIKYELYIDIDVQKVGRLFYFLHLALHPARTRPATGCGGPALVKFDI